MAPQNKTVLTCVNDLGEEDGRRYVEKTVSKHSQMVESIRKLSDGLMELEAKLKVTHAFVSMFHDSAALNQSGVSVVLV